MMSRKGWPFLGRGIGFPFRINPTKGGVQITEGSTDFVSLALAYLMDQWTIRETVDQDRANHIAEAILHILFTAQREHDTLPEFGSRINEILFEPNHGDTALLFETWLDVCTKRWERRAAIPVPDGVEWGPTGDGIDRNELPVRLSPEVIRSQAPGNLVAPFVDPRPARAQEYPLGDVDTAGHDWTSRYRRNPIHSFGSETFVRPRKMRPVDPRHDDQFYEVKYGDTWLLISYEMYGDTRFWWIIAELAANDAAEAGESRAFMDTTGDPEPGRMLRAPSRTRLLMELAA